MIEIEKKFALTPDQEKSLIEDAEFLDEKVFTDTYFDTVNFKLTTNDKWLRKRGEEFELKLSLNKAGDVQDRMADHYEELETDKEICQSLGLPEEGGLEGKLARNGYIEFAKFTTTRRKYKQGDFNIDLDTTDFGYNVGEIEVMVERIEDGEAAVKSIIEFVKDRSVTLAPARGKLTEYVRNNNPKQYKILVEAKVYREDDKS